VSRLPVPRAVDPSEQRYRALVESGRGLICTHDLSGVLLSVNRAAAERLGYAVEELVGRSLGEMQVIAEMGSTSAIKQAVKAGVGVSLLSRRAVEEECRAGSVWCLRVKDLKISRAFYLVTHRDRSRSPLAEAFRAFVEAEAV